MWFRAILFISTICWPFPSRGEKLWVQVSGLDGKGLPNITLTVKGHSSTGTTDVAGKVGIELPDQTAPGSWINLTLVRPLNYAMFAPVEGQAMVPLNSNEAQNYVAVWVCKPGDSKTIGNLKFIVAAASAIIRIASPGDASTSSDGDLKSALAAVAKKFSVRLEDLEQAIHQLHDKTVNPYEQGVIALFEQRYAAAVGFLEQALKDSEERKDPTSVLNASLFLGQALYLQGEYKAAADVFNKAATLQPADAGLLTGFALSLTKIRDYSGAARLFRRALAEREKELGPESPELARPMANLIFVLGRTKDYAEAAELQKRALPLWEKLVGVQDHQYALQINNLITLYSNNNDYKSAIVYATKQVELCKQANGADAVECAIDLGDLATLYYNNSDYTAAEPLLNEALAVFERKLSAYDSNIVACYRKLGRVLDAKGDVRNAESNFRKALDLLTQGRGSDNTDLVPILIDLAELLDHDKRYGASAVAYQRVLDIRRKNLPPGHKNVVTAMCNLGLELFDAGDYARAAPLLNEALPLQRKYLGEDSSVVLLIQKVLAQIQDNASRASR
jgi:tetratricopeptide (TPR) repeat protein